MKVFQPSSPILTSKILEHCISLDCPSYIRIARNEVKSRLRLSKLSFNKELDLAIQDALETMNQDIDGDGMIDIMEFTESMESLDDHDDTLDEDAKPKEFPSPMQRRMMSKSWNDTVCIGQRNIINIYKLTLSNRYIGAIHYQKFYNSVIY